MTSKTPGERVQTPAAAAIIGLKVRQIQSLAARGEIPGAAKLGSLWTFDLAKLRRWITSREAESCRTISINGAALGTGECRYAGATLEEAYRRALG